MYFLFLYKFLKNYGKIFLYNFYPMEIMNFSGNDVNDLN